MESAEAWGLQLANWTVEEPASAELWAPAALPVEYASIDIFDTYSLQTCSGGQQQLVEHCYSEHNPVQIITVRDDLNSEAKKPAVPIHLAKQVSVDRHTNGVFKHVASEFDKADIKAMEKKMHRYPACLETVDTCHTVPRFVAMGPYHHNRKALKPAEKVKHVAARYCITEGYTVEEVYDKVAEAADEARSLYDENVMACIGDMDFRHMMFFDACFLVQFMILRCGNRYKWMQESGGEDGDGSWKDFLKGFMSPKGYDILHDIMLLENQIPWSVVEAVLSFMPSSSSVSKDFVHKMRYLMLPDRHDVVGDEKRFQFDEDYTPPHILGLLRHHIVGRSKTKHDSKVKTITFSISAIELAEMGISVTPSKSMKLTAMSLDMEGHLLSGELCLPALSLDRDRASHLVNMAALELCTVKSFSRAKYASDSAVCSYLLLLAMLVHREEDVHELRVRGLLVGGGGLTNAEALRFLSSFQGLRWGQHYNYIMETIDSYRARRRTRTKMHAFFYNHWKTITAVIGVVSTVAGIIGTLASIKGSI
ncbi:unnamed protein product [Urochloa decumbens]|uniref:Uncharacterized protein n=1 Tax=Urochloa decumbens TaxID=240449 RepID=A0ABC9ANC6_9POAL